MLTAACLAAFLLAVPMAWLLARWGAERAARWCRPSPMSARLTNRQFDGWSRRIGWPAVLGNAGIDLIASRGSHWPWRAFVALGQVLVLDGLKVTARLGSRPKTGVPHSRLPCCSLMGLRARWGAQGKYR